MTVGYNKASAWLVIGLGAVCIVLALVTFGRGRESTLVNYMPLVGGGFGVLAGVLMLSRPLFALEDDRIVLFALIGPLKRAYPFGSRRELRITDGRLYVGDKKLPFRKGRCDAADWQQLAAAIRFG